MYATNLTIFTSDPVQCRIAMAISNHIIFNINTIKSLLSKSDFATADYVIEKLETFTFQSELAYHSEFPLVEKYLLNIRELLKIYHKHLYFYNIRIAAFDNFVDNFKILNKSAFSEVEHNHI